MGAQLMARKDVFKGTLEALINPPTRPQSKSILQSAALGAVESGLARGLQLTELDPDQIIQSEFEDRLPYDETSLADLVESIKEHGQQIPILVQKAEDGHFRIIYGRRRLAAVRTLGLKVRALVTHMDDEQRIIAQGIENSVRQDLSFIEKAMFAHRLREAGVEDGTIRSALNIDLGAPKATTISTMKMVVETLGEDVILAIGRAPGIGRPRWRALADAFRQRATELGPEARQALIASISHGPEFTAANQEDAPDPSDERFARAISVLTAKQATSNSPKQDAHGTLGQVKASRSAFAVTVRAKDNPEFHSWLVAQGDRLLHAWHDEWQSEVNSNPNKEAR